MTFTCPGCGKRRRTKKSDMGMPIVCECWIPGTPEYKKRAKREYENRTRREESPGVSIEFFTGAFALLEKIHGARMCGKVLEDIRVSLADAEMLFKSLAAAEKTPSRRRRVV